MRSLLFFCCASLAFAQGGTETKPKPEDYDVHGQAGGVSLGAEFMVHSFSGKTETYIAKDCLVVEVALYPPPDGKMDVRTGNFSLRINGKKPLQPINPQAVASMLQHPDWAQSGPQFEMGGGMGNTGVMLGGQRPQQVPGGQPQPGPRQSPVPGDPDAVQREPRITPWDLLLQTALPEITVKHSISGFLYFPYKGKTSSIKTLELLYGDTALKLR